MFNVGQETIMLKPLKQNKNNFDVEVGLVFGRETYDGGDVIWSQLQGEKNKTCSFKY